jgi:putative toxin-antitoxin system antitoxin component (TIGR02293 family)
MLALVDEGINFAALKRFESETGIPSRDIFSVLRTPPRTIARRKRSGRLRRDESERLVRLILLYQKALELMNGNRAAATRWLTTPKPALGRRPPLELAQTEFGAREVEDLIGRIEHGVIT